MPVLVLVFALVLGRGVAAWAGTATTGGGGTAEAPLAEPADPAPEAPVEPALPVGGVVLGVPELVGRAAAPRVFREARRDALLKVASGQIEWAAKWATTGQR